MPLRDSGKGVSGGFRGRWLRDALVVMEVALSLTLLIGAGLLMRSFVALRQAISECKRITCSGRPWPCPRTAYKDGGAGRHDSSSRCSRE